MLRRKCGAWALETLCGGWKLFTDLVSNVWGVLLGGRTLEKKNDCKAVSHHCPFLLLTNSS